MVGPDLELREEAYFVFRFLTIDDAPPFSEKAQPLPLSRKTNRNSSGH